MKGEKDIRSRSDISGEGEDKAGERDGKEKSMKGLRFTKFVFRAIDLFYSAQQNPCYAIDKSERKKALVTRDIVYDESLPELCKMDVYRPPGEEKLPAVIFVHGGGFIAGDKKYRLGMAQFFVHGGFAVFCVNYGIAPEYYFPEPLLHLITASEHIYRNAGKYNIDPDRILVAGDSAGGYYAAMLAAVSANRALAERLGRAETTFMFSAALFNCGVFDMELAAGAKFPLGLEKGVMKSMTGVPKGQLHKFSFRDAVAPSELVDPNFPPSFFIYSEHDMFCKGHSEIMMERLKEAGVYFESYRAKSRLSNHCFSLTWTSDDAVAANAAMLDFAMRSAAGKLEKTS